MKKVLIIAALLALSPIAIAKGPGAGASGQAGPVIIDPKTGKEITGGYVIRDGQCINLRNGNPVTMSVCTKAGVK